MAPELHATKTKDELPLALGAGRVDFLSELISFVSHNKNHAHRHEGRRDDKDEDSAAQGFYHPCPSRSGLCIAKRAALRKGWGRADERTYCDQRSGKQQKRPFALKRISRHVYQLFSQV
jgi:hypothetical protein